MSLAPPINYAFEPPFLFDCRFEGVAYQRTEGRFRAATAALEEWAKAPFAGPLVLPEGSPESHKAISDAAAELCRRPTQQSRGRLYQATASLRAEIQGGVTAMTGRTDVHGHRRMGIGDQCVLMALIQAVAAEVGYDNVVVWLDRQYPGTAPLWPLSGLPCEWRDSQEPASIRGFQTISLRRHALANPTLGSDDCDIGEALGNPLAQVLFWLGWHHRMPCQPIALELEGVTSTTIFDENLHRPAYVTCQPLEITRSNERATPALFARVLLESVKRCDAAEIVFGSSPAERGALRAFMDRVGDVSRTTWLESTVEVRQVCYPLEQWLREIHYAAEHVTANSGGMWLGIGTRTPLTIVSVPDHEKHGRQWEPNRTWFSLPRWKTVRVVEAICEDAP